MKIKNIHIIIFFVIIFVLWIGNYFFIRFQKNNSYKMDNTWNDYNVSWIYYHYKDLFNFDEDGECIITVSELIKGQSVNDFDIIHDEDGNDCLGYYIINKDSKNKIKIDSSHICEMIDY